MQISGKTQLVGLIGWPVVHSLSPAMHNAAAADLSLDLVYLPLGVHPGALAESVRGLAALGFLGVNVTVPHKETVIPLLDSVDPAAQAIGAVNTIVFDGPVIRRRATGYNTDWFGFMDDLQAHDVSVTGAECLVLGAGGSARAVAYGLGRAGAQVHLFGRRMAQVEKLASDLNAHGLAGQIRSHDWTVLSEGKRLPATSGPIVLIANTTPVGMAPNAEASPWPAYLPFPAGVFVYDLVYNPDPTRLMDQAAAAGCRTANGAGMLVRQGAAAFQLWTGQAPDVQVMAAAFHKSQTSG